MYTLRIGEIVRHHRKAENMTQEELAEHLGVTKAAVSKWETGESLPDITMLPALAELFRITVDDLLGACRHDPPPKIVTRYQAPMDFSCIADRSIFEHGTVTECRLKKDACTVVGNRNEWEVIVSMESTETDFLTTLQRCIRPGYIFEVHITRLENGRAMADDLPDRAYVCTEKIWAYKVSPDCTPYVRAMFQEQYEMGLRGPDEF
ncbi:MAG: helix-turn-helix transcriptional regulator [Clostridia bacterium]|nr:helix-turn-helix transcriptional regulator [Clostridia bacterium]